MVDYHYDQAIVWSNLANFVQRAAGVRSVSILDPATGLTPTTLTQDAVPVSYVTADSDGRATFTATCDTVIADFGAGPLVLLSTEKLSGAIDGGVL